MDIMAKLINKFIKLNKLRWCERVKCNPLFLLFGDTTSHHMATEKRHRPKEHWNLYETDVSFSEKVRLLYVCTN